MSVGVGYGEGGKRTHEKSVHPNHHFSSSLPTNHHRGILNVVHGGHETVNAICDAPEISAVAFVGSTPGGRHVFARAAAAGKRVQCNLGAKNHAVILPDAHREATLAALTGAAFGAAGQRCMAISAAVFVGGADSWMDALADRARALVVGPGAAPGVDVGPMISRDARDRAVAIVSDAEARGTARVLVDGRRVTVPGYEGGNFFGPTLIKLEGEAATSNPAYTEEIFAPALVCLDAPTLDAALAMVNANPNGNGTAIFTRSGAAAKKFASVVDVGMVGINVPIPVPLPFFSFTGWRGSFAGDLHMYGKAGVDFFTRPKTVTAAWRAADDDPGAVAPGLHGVGAAAPKA